MNTTTKIENIKNALLNVPQLNAFGFIEMITNQSKKVSKTVAKQLNINPTSIQKHSRVSVLFGSSYQTRVNNAQLREKAEKQSIINGKEINHEAFIPKKSYFEHVGGALAQNIKDNSKQYCVVSPQYDNINSSSFYTMNGKKVSFDFIKTIFNPSALKSYKSKTQNLEKEIKFLAIGLESIISVSVNKQKI